LAVLFFDFLGVTINQAGAHRHRLPCLVGQLHLCQPLPAPFAKQIRHRRTQPLLMQHRMYLVFQTRPLPHQRGPQAHLLPSRLRLPVRLPRFR
jgi:hypothetical protein